MTFYANSCARLQICFLFADYVTCISHPSWNTSSSHYRNDKTCDTFFSLYLFQYFAFFSLQHTTLLDAQIISVVT